MSNEEQQTWGDNLEPGTDPATEQAPTGTVETHASSLDPDAGLEADAPDDGDTFDREYVTRLRGEASTHRRNAREAGERADALAARVWALRVAATGRLADPADLEAGDPDMSDDDLEAAVDELLTRKPHLAARRATGTFGLGEPSSPPAASLASILRANA